MRAVAGRSSSYSGVMIVGSCWSLWKSGSPSSSLNRAETLFCVSSKILSSGNAYFLCPPIMTLKKSVTTIPFHTCSQIIMFKNMPLYYTRQNLVGCVRVCIFTSAKNCISTYFVFNYRHDEIKLTLSLCWRTVSKRLWPTARNPSVSISNPSTNFETLALI